MGNIFGDIADWATTSPEFVKKRAKKAHESVESPSLFDSPTEKFTKPAIHAAIDTADTFATPLDAAALLTGGAGFAGAKIADRLRKLPKVSNFEHYIDAIRLGKTPAEATKIASSGGRTAADKRRIAETVEAQFKTRSPKPVESVGKVEKAPYLRTIYGPTKQAAGRGKSVIDLAESLRKNARRPYGQTTQDIDDRWDALRRAQKSRGR